MCHWKKLSSDHPPLCLRGKVKQTEGQNPAGSVVDTQPPGHGGKKKDYRAWGTSNGCYFYAKEMGLDYDPITPTVDPALSERSPLLLPVHCVCCFSCLQPCCPCSLPWPNQVFPFSSFHKSLWRATSFMKVTLRTARSNFSSLDATNPAAWPKIEFLGQMGSGTTAFCTATCVLTQKCFWEVRRSKDPFSLVYPRVPREVSG